MTKWAHFTICLVMLTRADVGLAVSNGSLYSFDTCNTLAHMSYMLG